MSGAEGSGKQDLFEQYLAVCNQAIALNAERTPFKEIWAGVRRLGIDKSITVSVIDDKFTPQFSLSLNGDLIIVKNEKNMCRTDCPCTAQWRVRKSYLLDVIENPQIYIRNPAMIDWEWLQKLSELSG